MWGKSMAIDDAAAQAELDSLIERVRDCRLCPRMEGRRRVFGPANGFLGARALVIAEAPGRLGGERYGAPLVHDQTGRNFTALLATAEIERSWLLITNTIVCAPLADGKNDTPRPHEVRNCSRHLADLLSVLDPPLVVTLGIVALGAVALLAPHNLILRRDVGVPQAWSGRTLLPLYHPGPRALIHRPLQQQRGDYALLAQALGAIDGGDGRRD